VTHFDAALAYDSLNKTRSAGSNVLRVFILADLLAFGAAGLISMALLDYAQHGAPVSVHAGISAGLCLAVMLWFRSKGHYRARHALANMVRPVLMACGLAFLAASTLQVSFEETRLTSATAGFWASVPVLILAMRWTARALLLAAGRWQEPVTLLTSAAIASDRARLIEHNTDHGLTVTRTLDLAGFEGLDDRTLSARLSRLTDRTLFLAPDERSQPVANRIVARLSAAGAAYFYQPAIGPAPTQNVDIIDYPPTEGFVFQISDSLNRPLARAAKRVLETLAAGAGLIVLSPLLVLIAVLVRRDGGPALYSQPRVGRDGKIFQCLKFRSMAVDADRRLGEILSADPVAACEWNTYQKLTRDPRITPVGRVLRKISADELPQLINVVRGEMSLVGPRPMTIDQQAAYGASLESYVRVRPGLTGMWQVNGRNATSFTERARLDDWYARNWSLWRDIVILVRTVREVLFPNGQ
jgi:Undecaprenyl-phosphate galactose phosphotransferase WbaP